MLIYEVNLTIKPSFFTTFLDWLKPHIHDILKLNGFMKADLLFCLDDEEKEDKKLSVHYYIDTYEHYQEYLTHHAPQLRKETLEKFPEGYTVTRRVLEINDSFC